MVARVSRRVEICIVFSMFEFDSMETAWRQLWESLREWVPRFLRTMLVVQIPEVSSAGWRHGIALDTSCDEECLARHHDSAMIRLARPRFDRAW